MDNDEVTKSQEPIGKIPDEDVLEWMKVFQEMNLSSKEIDRVMMRTNDTYAYQKMATFIEKLSFLLNRLIPIWTKRQISLEEQKLIEHVILNHFRETDITALRFFTRVTDYLLQLNNEDLKIFFKSHGIKFETILEDLKTTVTKEFKKPS